MSELEACRSEGRNYSSEVYRLKASYDETMEQLDVVRRENKNLADEIKCVSSLCIKTSKCFTSHIFLTGIYWINLGMEAAQFMTWTNKDAASRWRRRSFRGRWRKQRGLWSRRRTRLVEILLNKWENWKFD